MPLPAYWGCELLKNHVPLDVVTTDYGLEEVTLAL